MSERPIFKVDNHHVRDFSQEDSEVLGREILDTHFNKVMDNEMPKSPEEIKFIDSFNTYLAQEFKRLDLDDYRPFPIEKIHFLPSSSFESTSPTIGVSGSEGFYSPHHHAIFINKEKARSNLDLFISIVHEMTHAASFRLYQKSDKEKQVYENYKTGYATDKRSQAEKALAELKTENKDEVDVPFESLYVEKFTGFNEAVTDLFVYQFFLNNKAKIAADFAITEDDWKKFSVASYLPYCNLVDNIMDLIAQKKNEDKSSVWKKFKLGMFTGRMMHLRAIEEVLEPKALRKLSSLGCRRLDKEREGENIEPDYTKIDARDQEILEYLNSVIAQQKTAQ